MRSSTDGVEDDDGIAVACHASLIYCVTENMARRLVNRLRLFPANERTDQGRQQGTARVNVEEDSQARQKLDCTVPAISGSPSISFPVKQCFVQLNQFRLHGFDREPFLDGPPGGRSHLPRPLGIFQ